MKRLILGFLAGILVAWVPMAAADGPTAGLTVIGTMTASSATSEHVLVNTSLAPRTFANSNVLSLQHTDVSSSSAARFLDRLGNERGAVGYGNGTGAWYLDNTVYLAAGSFGSNGSALAEAPPKLVLSQQGLHLGVYRESPRLLLSRNWDISFHDPLGFKSASIPATGAMGYGEVNLFTSDGASHLAGISEYPASFNYRAFPAAGGAVWSTGAGGLSLFARDAGASVRFYAGGDASVNLAMTIGPNGVVTFEHPIVVKAP